MASNRAPSHTETVSALPRYRWDDLRRFAAALGSAVGLAPPRALALASHLLWYDAAGAAPLGMATLPEWLEAMDAGRVDVAALGQVRSERSALAVFDGQNGVPPLLLERAAELAVEKARETAVGLIRVAQLGAVGSVAAVTAGIAVGPMAGLVVGPNHLWGMALPSAAGLPVVIDSALAAVPAPQEDARKRAKPGRAPAALVESLGMAAEVLLPEQGWLVAAVSVPALEPLASFHERVTAALSGSTEETLGRLLPSAWDAHRRAARAQGIALTATARKSLENWARRLAVAPPEPIAAGCELPGGCNPPA
jgi:LDH2 family malate/lactate/ureidoglycolate dehydrogenase